MYVGLLLSNRYFVFILEMSVGGADTTSPQASTPYETPLLVFEFLLHCKIIICRIFYVFPPFVKYDHKCYKIDVCVA